jgi:hypothetical protein
MKVIFKLAILVMFVLIFIMASCQNKKKVESGGNGEIPVIVRQDTSSLVSFLFFEIHRDSISNSNVLKLKEKKDIMGKLKSGYEDFSVFSIPCLLIDYYEDGIPVHNSKMEHPLFRSVEYAEDNGLRMETIQSDSGEFSLRCQRKPGKIQKIVISEKIDENTIRKIFTLNL